MKMESRAAVVSSLLTFLSLTCTAHPLDTWYSRFTNNPATSFYGVAHGSGHFVAVGASGAIARSTNGIHWSVTNPSPQTLNDIAFGNGRFAAVGNGGTVLTSSNAIAWENRSPGTNIFLRNVVYGNSRFVAVGYTTSPALNYSLVSTDGILWTHYYLSSNKSAGGLAFGNGLFIVPLSVGTNLLSADGISWWQQPTGLTNDLYMIGSGNNTLVAFDIHNLTFTSDDGTNWTFRGANTLLRPENLAYGNGSWAAVGRGMNASYSDDLLQWTTVANNKTVAYKTCFGNGSFVTVGAVICQSTPLIRLQALAGLPGRIAFWGPTGVTYQLQTLTNPGQPNWQTVSNLIMDTTPYLWTDPDTAGYPQKLYRALLP